MQNVYVVSKYLRRKGFYHVFHFIGYFNGVKVKQVYVHGGHFEIGEEYAIALHDIQIEGETLRGKLLHQKKLYEN